MPQLIEYLIRLSAILMIMYLFYWLALSRLTFYTSNRWYLLGYSVVAFVIPLIDIAPVLEQARLSNNELVQWVPVIETEGLQLNNRINDHSMGNTWSITFLLLIVGTAGMLLRFVIQYYSVRAVRRSSQLISDGDVKVYQVNKNIIPFSFGNAIFINQHKHTPDELKDIIKHEFIHVRQKHTIDILWSEWLCILNWYNPFAWLIRHAIRQNLEFIADNKILQNGIDKKQYQYLLLKVIGVPQFGIATSFNFTSLKKRIAMMNKMRSAKLHLIKFLFVLPLLAVILLAFRNRVSRPVIQTTLSTDALIVKDGLQPATVIVDTIPATPHQPVKPHIFYVPPANSKGYLITVADNHGECIVIVKNKQNKIIKAVSLVEWDANPEDNRKLFGEIPSPTDSSARVIIHKVPTAPSPPSGDIVPVPMPETVSGVHVKDQKITVTLKNGKSENYDLSNPVQKATFEKKYGRVPVPPASPEPNLPNHSNAHILKNAMENEKDSAVIIGTQKNNTIHVDRGGKVTLKTFGDFDGLIIVNDKEYDKKSFEKNVILHANDIQSVDVLKGESAKQSYGEQGRNGVIKIVTKIKIE